MPEDDTPSCSTVESLDKQDLYVNDTLATHALNLLWQLFRYRQISHHGVYVDTRTSLSTPLAIDPKAWQRMKRRNRKPRRDMRRNEAPKGAATRP